MAATALLINSDDCKNAGNIYFILRRTCGRRNGKALPFFFLNIHYVPHRSSIAAVHCRRPCLSCGCGASVEQSARFRHGVNVAARVQATPEDCTVREKLLNTGCFRRLEHLHSHVILFAFNFVRCPCSRSDIMPA